MTEKKLLYFLAAADCENISQAAEQLYIAQPSLSKIISGMEEELGYPLFERIGKRIVLNENGRIFYRYAKEIVIGYENARSALSERNRRPVRTLCVGVCVSSQLMPRLLRQFQETQMAQNEQIQMKASYPLDFARDNIDLMIDADAQVKKEPGKFYLLSENIVLALPKGHPLESRSSVSLADTLEYPYVLPDENTRMGSILARFFRERDLQYPVRSIVTNNSYVQCEFVAQGLGISLIPEKSWINAGNRREIVLRAPKDAPMRRNIFFQYHPGKYQSEIMTRFGEFLKAYYKSMQG